MFPLFLYNFELHKKDRAQCIATTFIIVCLYFAYSITYSCHTRSKPFSLHTKCNKRDPVMKTESWYKQT